MKVNGSHPLRRITILIETVLVLMAIGCTVGPDYARPELPLPDRWQGRDVQQTSGPSAASPRHWWQQLDDPLLLELLGQAAANNTDVRVAVSRVREARFQRQMQRAYLFPTVDAAASAQMSERRDDDSSGGMTELYSAGLDAGWEVDLFGGNRRSLEAAQADLEAEMERLNQVMVTLLAEVVINYIDLRTYQARLDVAERNLAVQEQTWRLLDAMDQTGMGDPLAVEQSRYNLASSQAKIPDLMTGQAAAVNRLAVLTARPSASIHTQLSEMKALPQVSAAMATGVPADVLRRRPDIREAERTLAARTARVGEAMADRYPSFTLNGSIGLEALSLGDLFSSATRIWSLGPSLRLPIFNAGEVGNNIKVQEELRQQALIQYEAAVRTALEEVENALVAYDQEQRKITSLQAAVTAARNAAELAGHQYVTGMTGFSSVLDAQRSQLSFEDQLAVSRGAVLADLVRLYKALGGGWESYRPLDGDDSQVDQKG